jgi:hypothetical protein
MEIASSSSNALIQQQAMQYSQADAKQGKSGGSVTNASTPQASLESAPQGVSESSAIPGTTRIGGSIDTYA